MSLRPHRAVLTFALLVAALTISIPARAQDPASAPTPNNDPSTWPVAGYHNGLFFIRSKDDVFRLYLQGRLNVDWLSWLGPGVPRLPASNALKSTFTLRRARIEIGGEFFLNWQWQVSAEFGQTSVDNPGANIAGRVCTVDPVSGAMTCTDQENAVENPSVKPIPTDVFANYVACPWLNFQVGQFLLPFTMENRISDNVTPFLERSLPVRALGAPLTRDIGAMVWGEAPNRVLYYSVGIYDGDGPNRTNADNRYDFVGRVFARPFAVPHLAAKHGLEDAQIGLSGRYGTRDPHYVGYDITSMTTQEGWAFFRGTYRDSQGHAIHILPSADQSAFAADLYVPYSRLDFTSEIVYSASDTRETLDGAELALVNQRAGALYGYGFYVQAGVWLIGSRDIIGFPSYGKPLHVDLATPSRPAEHGVELLAKYEHLHATYHGSSRGGTSDASTPNGDIDVRSGSLGVNYWATRHVRVSLDYGLYFFPDSEPATASTKGGPTQGAGQRAIAPSQALAKGIDDGARDTGHTLHEISARVGVQF